MRRRPPCAGTCVGSNAKGWCRAPTAGFLVCPIGDVDTIITDAGASDETVAPFQRLGIQVVRV